MKKKFLKGLCLSMMFVLTLQIVGYCEKVYSDKELIELATAYYKSHSSDDYIPGNIEIDHVDGDEVLIHLYDVGYDFTFTSNWYTVNRKTGKGKDFFENEIDISLEEN